MNISRCQAFSCLSYPVADRVVIKLYYIPIETGDQSDGLRRIYARTGSYVREPGDIGNWPLHQSDPQVCGLAKDHSKYFLWHLKQLVHLISSMVL
jgi:hypothetical protein